MKPLRFIRCMALVMPLCMAMSVTTPASAFTWRDPMAIWKNLRDGTTCGGHSADGGRTYVACRIRFEKTALLRSSHPTWSTPTSIGAARWCNVKDPDHGNGADLCYVDFTDTDGGIGTHGVRVGVRDLGGAAADGSVVLAQQDGAIVTDPDNSSTYAKMRMATIVINVNNAAASLFYTSNSTASTYTVPSGKQDLQTVIMHEFGHASGFGHPTNVPSLTGPVMTACSQPGGVNFGHTDDGNAVRWYYGGFNTSRWGSPSSVHKEGC